MATTPQAIRPASHISVPHDTASDGHRPVVMHATMNAHSAIAARVTGTRARCRARASAISTASSGTASSGTGCAGAGPVIAPWQVRYGWSCPA